MESTLPRFEQMTKQELSSVLPSLILKSQKFDEKRTFFLPNQDRKWLDYVVSKKNVRSDKQILLIGGVLYSCYLAAKGYEVTVVEKSPLAAISQLYVAWLLDNGLTSSEVQKYLLLHLFNDRFQPHRRKNILIPPNDYCNSVNKFKEFVDLNQTKSEDLFDKIYKITPNGNRKVISLILKGVGVLGFDSQKFALPKKIIIEDVQEYASQVKNTYGLILSNNVVDFFNTKMRFFSTMSKLLSGMGILEVTLYSKASQSEIRNVFNISESKRLIGQAQLLTEVFPEMYKESFDKLLLNKNIFLLPKRKIIESIDKQMPYWIKDLSDKGRFEKKYNLFNKNSMFFTIIDGHLSEVTK